MGVKTSSSKPSVTTKGKFKNGQLIMDKSSPFESISNCLKDKIFENAIEKAETYSKLGPATLYEKGKFLVSLFQSEPTNDLVDKTDKGFKSLLKNEFKIEEPETAKYSKSRFIDKMSKIFQNKL